MVDFSLENWMANLSPVIAKRTLIELYIPGSHNSAINEDCLTTHYPFPFPQFPTAIGPDAPDAILKIPRVIPVSLFIGSIIRAWGVTQKLSFHDQLLKGIRYFDLRITKVSGKFKFTHTLVSYTDIFILLSPVESFMREHDKEVLILDCQHFYDMNDAGCDQLLDGFHSLFGDLLCTSDEINISQALFETYIKRNKRVLLIWKTDYANKLSSRNRSLVYKREEALESEWASIVQI
ncbi:unnamed protein product [Rhizoctonia solani]|uniref:Phosphatidylinositol-specific phospholipase C X domain-containing protein n=1 Tax=Rhizoctonia solani TaxID=456999 RepID=A0A8H3CZC3_9AGAM|nr:unnamed protein product [Rhizoctonia solani]